MNLTNEDLQEILRLLNDSSFDVLRLQTDRFKLTLRRNGKGDWTQEKQVLSSPRLLKAEVSPSLPAARVGTKPLSSLASGLVDVSASLPGTFYRAPRPSAPAFVEVGSRVEIDTVVGIVETMKLMNAVHAGARGEIAEICLENAQLVESGAVLMRIKPGAP